MPSSTSFIRVKNNAASDLTVDTYPSSVEDVLPIFKLNLHPPIYHAVLLARSDTSEDDSNDDIVVPKGHSRSRSSSVSSTTYIATVKTGTTHLRLPRGESGQAPFAKACKKYGGRWQDAEWSDSYAVPKGDGIPGERGF